MKTLLPLKKSLRASRRPLARLFSVTAVLALSVSSAYAVTLYWDPGMNDIVNGGSGPWDLTTTNWTPDNLTDQAWPNGGSDVASFGTLAGGPSNSAGTVTTKAGILVNQIIFNTGGYIIANGTGGSLTLSGTTPTVNVNTGLTDTINSALLGTAGLTKTGAGTLVLSGANTYTGTTTIGAGTLQFAAGGSLAAPATVNFAATGTLNLGGTTQTLDSLTVAAAVLTGTATNGSLILSGANNFSVQGIAASGSTALDLSGLSSFSYAQTAAGRTFNVGLGSTTTSNSTLTLSNGANTITATGMTIGTGGASSVGGTATLNLGAANTINTDILQLGGYRSTVGALKFSTGLTAPTLTLRGAAGGTTPLGSLVIGLVQSGGAPQTGTFDTSLGSINAIVNNVNVYTLGTGTPSGVNPTTGATNNVGTFTMGAGTLNAGTITLGQAGPTITGAISANTVTATVNQNAGAVLSDSVVFNAPNAGNGILSNYQSTYNLGSAATPATLSAASVALGANVSSTASRATLNFINGTISNYDNTANGFGGQGNANGSTTTNVQDLTIAGRTGGGTAVDANTLNIVLASTGTHTFAAEKGRSITVAPTAIITGSGGLTVSDQGTVNLNGANTYTGGTTISNGILRLANTTGSATGTGAVGLSGGAGVSVTLSGTGISTGLLTVTNFNRLSPGLNIATAGNLTLGSSATVGGITLTSANLDFDLANTAATAGGGTNDLITTAGTLTLGTVGVNITELGGTLLTGTPYTLITGAAAVSGFNANNLTTTFTGGQTYTATYNTAGNVLTVTFTAVPEPSTWMMFLVGLAGLTVTARFRARRA